MSVEKGVFQQNPDYGLTPFRSSQVVLALQLPFAMFPLLHFTCSRKRMGTWRNGWLLIIAGWASALVITAMDIWGLPDSLKSAWQVIMGG